MNNPPTKIQYTPEGHDCYYSSQTNSCEVIIRGYTTPDKRIIERGGPTHPDDKTLISVTIKNPDEITTPLCQCRQPVRETFEDVLLDTRDLIGTPIFRNAPQDMYEKRMFASAYDAAQKIRAEMNILGVSKLIVSLTPHLFALVDCFARDKSGTFWLIFCSDEIAPNPESIKFSIAAYILEAGKYVPTNATVKLGVWNLAYNPPKFVEITNRRIEARDFMINEILKTPF